MNPRKRKPTTPFFIEIGAGKQEHYAKGREMLTTSDSYNDEYKWSFIDNSWVRFRPANIMIRTTHEYLMKNRKRT